MRRLWTLLLAVALTYPGLALAQGSGQPAELPPDSYRGMQYVDSKGCAFIRAGTDGETLWIPRVSAGGKLLCGFPPSGKRVPVVGEPGADVATADPNAPVEAEETPSKAEATTDPQTSDPEVEQNVEGYLVAVGSFGFASNVAKASAGVQALGYPAFKGKAKSGEQGLTTVFAGPFGSKADAEEARAKIRAAGFPDAIVMAY